MVSIDVSGFYKEWAARSGDVIDAAEGRGPALSTLSGSPTVRSSRTAFLRRTEWRSTPWTRAGSLPSV